MLIYLQKSEMMFYQSWAHQKDMSLLLLRIHPLKKAFLQKNYLWLFRVDMVWIRETENYHGNVIKNEGTCSRGELLFFPLEWLKCNIWLDTKPNGWILCHEQEGLDKQTPWGMCHFILVYCSEPSSGYLSGIPSQSYRLKYSDARRTEGSFFRLG